MGMREIDAIVLVLSIAGISLIIYGVVDILVSFAINIYEGTPGRRMARRIKDLGLGKEKEESEAKIRVRVNTIRNRPQFPVWTVIVAALLTGVLFLFTKSALSLGLVGIFYVVRAWIINNVDHKEAKDVWAFMLDLRVKLSTKGSLFTAMKDVAAAGRTNFSQILSIYMKWNIDDDALSLLKKIAEDTNLPYIEDVIQKSKAAREGNLSQEQAIQMAISNIQEEIDTGLREQLQQVPARIMIIVFPLLLGPALVLLIYPVVAQLLASLSFTV